MEFERLIKLIGNVNYEKIATKNILIVGVGGVGGYVVEGLIRSGITNITIIDYDTIDITNINRQIIALNSNIGMKKIEVIKNRMLDINNNINIVIKDMFLNESNINEVFNNNFDYVIDACDTVNTKKLIIKKCLENNIKVISCMGTANKLNPSLLSICELKNTKYDKLAKVMRKWYNDEKIKKKVMVVSSTEQAVKTEGLGSTSFVPSVAGMLCVSYVINDIIKNE